MCFGQCVNRILYMRIRKENERKIVFDGNKVCDQLHVNSCLRDYHPKINVYAKRNVVLTRSFKLLVSQSDNKIKRFNSIGLFCVGVRIARESCLNDCISTKILRNLILLSRYLIFVRAFIKRSRVMPS